jgi:hypothetical protein
MQYTMMKELGPESLLVRDESGREFIFDRVEFPIAPRENLRRELREELRKAVTATIKLKLDHLLQYTNLEKFADHHYLVRKDRASGGLRLLSELEPTAAAGLLQQFILFLQGLHNRGIVSGGFSRGQLRLDDAGSLQVQDPLAIGVLRLYLDDSYRCPNPPEVVRGGEWGAAADIFSWGVIAYQLMTGADPFEAPTQEERVTRIMQGSIIEPRDHVPEITPAFAQLIMACLQPEPARRPNVDEMAATMQRLKEEEGFLQKGEAVKSGAKETKRRQRHEARERFFFTLRRYQTGIVFCGIILLLLGILFVLSPRSKPYLTTKDSPEQVLRYYFEAVTEINPALAIETLSTEKNSYQTLVDNLHVMNQMNRAYSNSNRYAIRPEFENLRIEKIGETATNARFRASYVLKLSYPIKDEFTQRVDEYTLEPSANHIWRITAIRVLEQKEFQVEKYNLPGATPAAP